MEEEELELYPETERELPKKRKTIEECQKLCKVWAEQMRQKEKGIIPGTMEEEAVKLFS